MATESTSTPARVVPGVYVKPNGTARSAAIVTAFARKMGEMSHLRDFHLLPGAQEALMAPEDGPEQVLTPAERELVVAREEERKVSQAYMQRTADAYEEWLHSGPKKSKKMIEVWKQRTGAEHQEVGHTCEMCQARARLLRARAVLEAEKDKVVAQAQAEALEREARIDRLMKDRYADAVPQMSPEQEAAVLAAAVENDEKHRREMKTAQPPLPTKPARTAEPPLEDMLAALGLTEEEVTQWEDKAVPTTAPDGSTVQTLPQGESLKAPDEERPSKRAAGADAS